MIKVRKSELSELNVFWKMEQQSHAKAFINASNLDKHYENFKKLNLVYLSIEDHNDELAGYIILALSPNTKEVEFRRIIIDQHHRGIGQTAIKKMEMYCDKELNCKRIWLDVYEDNFKGIHIYEKLDYKKFKETKFDNRNLYFYEKNL